jgi:hypothetical protein
MPWTLPVPHAGLGAEAYTRSGQLALMYPAGKADEAERLPQAPYPPGDWLAFAARAPTIQELLMAKMGLEAYQTYLGEKTAELSAYRPDWRLGVGVLAGIAGALLLIRRK